MMSWSKNQYQVNTHTLKLTTTLLLLQRNQVKKQKLNKKFSSNQTQQRHLKSLLLKLEAVYTDQNRLYGLQCCNTHPTYFQKESRSTISAVANMVHMIKMVMSLSTFSTMVPQHLANSLNMTANQKLENADHSAQRQDSTLEQEL